MYTFPLSAHAVPLYLQRVLQDLSHYAAMQSCLESSILLNTACSSFQELLELSEKVSCAGADQTLVRIALLLVHVATVALFCGPDHRACLLQVAFSELNALGIWVGCCC